MVAQDNMTQALKRTASWLDSASDRLLFAAVSVPLLLVFLVTGSWTVVKSPDVFTNIATSWTIGTSGTIYLDDFSELIPYRGHASWIVEGPNGAVSQYPPGAALLAAPLYAIWPAEASIGPIEDSVVGDFSHVDADFEVIVPPLAPAVIVGATTTALAMAFVALALRRYRPGSTSALWACVFALGTGAWVVAADDLWQHGPAMLWVAAAVYLSDSKRYFLGGLSLGLALITRPPTAIIAIAIGIGHAVHQRRLRPLVLVAIGSATGLITLILYNTVVFESVSITGGYSGAIAEGGEGGLGAYLRNVVGGLISLDRGLLVYSPFIGVLAAGVVWQRRNIPVPLLAAAAGAVAYLLVHWKINRYSGGAGFVGYRYPLEAVVAAAPALAWTAEPILQRRRPKLLLGGTVALAVFLYTASQVIAFPLGG